MAIPMNEMNEMNELKRIEQIIGALLQKQPTELEPAQINVEQINEIEEIPEVEEKPAVDTINDMLENLNNIKSDADMQGSLDQISKLRGILSLMKDVIELKSAKCDIKTKIDDALKKQQNDSSKFGLFPLFAEKDFIDRQINIKDKQTGMAFSELYGENVADLGDEINKMQEENKNKLVNYIADNMLLADSFDSWSKFLTQKSNVIGKHLEEARIEHDAQVLAHKESMGTMEINSKILNEALRLANSIQESIDYLTQSKEKNQAVQQELEAIRGQINYSVEQKEGIEESTKQKKEAERKKEQLNKKVNDLKDDIDAAQLQKIYLTLDVYELREKFCDLDKQFEALQSTIDSGISEKQSLMSQKQISEKKIREDSQGIMVLAQKMMKGSRLLDLSAQTECEQGLLRQVSEREEALSKELEASEKQRELLIAEKEGVQKSLESAAKEEEELNEQLEQLEKQQQESETQLTEQEEICNQADLSVKDINGKIEQLTTSLANKEKDASDLTSEISQYNKQISDSVESLFRMQDYVKQAFEANAMKCSIYGDCVELSCFKNRANKNVSQFISGLQAASENQNSMVQLAEQGLETLKQEFAEKQEKFNEEKIAMRNQIEAIDGFNKEFAEYTKYLSKQLLLDSTECLEMAFDSAIKARCSEISSRLEEDIQLYKKGDAPAQMSQSDKEEDIQLYKKGDAPAQASQSDKIARLINIVYPDYSVEDAKYSAVQFSDRYKNNIINNFNNGNTKEFIADIVDANNTYCTKQIDIVEIDDELRKRLSNA